MKPGSAVRSWIGWLIAGLLMLGGVGAAMAQDGDYVLGPGDIVKITVFQNPDLTTETRVAETGAITFPLIGAVGVAGQSAGAVERIIAQKLRDGGFVNRPQVNVNVLQFKSIQVSVLGQVNRPGRLAARPGEEPGIRGAGAGRRDTADGRGRDHADHER